MRKLNRDDEVARTIWLKGIEMVQRLKNLEQGTEFAEYHLLDIIYYLKRIDTARDANIEAGHQKYNLYKRAMPLSEKLLYIEQLFARGVLKEKLKCERENYRITEHWNEPVWKPIENAKPESDLKVKPEQLQLSSGLLSYYASGLSSFLRKALFGSSSRL
jgi:ribosomal protein L31E